MTTEPQKKLKTYRENIESCLAWAKNARNPELRKGFLLMAKSWTDAAMRLERTLGICDESQNRVDSGLTRLQAQQSRTAYLRQQIAVMRKNIQKISMEFTGDSDEERHA